MRCQSSSLLWASCRLGKLRKLNTFGDIGGPGMVTDNPTLGCLPPPQPGYHWIYWVGPFIGSLMAVGFYLLLKSLDFSSVVFGQDADHELTEAERKVAEERHAVGAGLFKRAGRHLVVFHGKGGQGGSKASLVPFDANNPEMANAIRQGQASILDPSDAERGLLGDAAAPPPGATIPEGGRANGVPNAKVELDNGVPSMRPEAQDVGGLQMPGTTSAGLARLGVARNILSS